LRDRYVKLVQSHSGVSQSLACGIHATPSVGSAFAATQAAYRFFHNPRVTLRGLAIPLLEFARQEVPLICDRCVLIAHDWSPLSLQGHTRKKDRISLSQRRVPEGYELQSALAISDRDGLPIAPLMIRLRAADGVHCSREYELQAPLSPLDELDPAMSFVDHQAFARPAIHLVDAEADSVAHYRLWSSRPHRLYLVRGDDRLVEHNDEERKCSVIQAELHAAGRFRATREVLYHGKRAYQFVAEVPVYLLRAGQRNRPNSNDRQRIPGNPLLLRLVISEVRSKENALLSTWFLFSNAPSDIDASTLALWYYWRWNTEEFFKLLKSAGVHMEHWQQDSADAIARRLLVACMACVVVWRLARSEHPEAGPARRLLVRLSGRQMKRGTEYTLPAMMAGLWTLLAMMQTLEEHSLDVIRTLANVVFGQPP
jgi:hypothetical protein